MLDEMEAQSARNKMECDTVVECSSSRQTLEQEMDLYKEKILHLKLAVREMQQSLQSQKIRKEGVETISVLLKESRQQIATLENQKRALETAVRNLQNRLANHGLSNSVTFEENELFIPGTSKQILDNLAKENARLWNLAEMSGSFEDAKNLHENMRQVESMNSMLQMDRDNLLQKVSDLENTLNCSDNEKDWDICQLRGRIEMLQGTSRTRDVLCQSMGGEVAGLRQRLKDFVFQCQQLDVKLEESETATSTTEQEVQATSSSAHTHKFSQDSPDGNILTEENSKLKEEIQALRVMNKRWQDYNSDRERYTQDLNNNYRDLQHRYKQDMEMRISEEKERHLNNLLVTAKEKLEKMTKENQEMEDKLVAAHTTIAGKTAEIQHLNASQGGMDEATINALKAQIQLCTEDFETERQDRATAQAKAYKLSEEVRALRREKQQLQQKLMAASVPDHQFQRAQQFAGRDHPPVIEVPQLQSRGWQAEAVVTDTHGIIEVDSVLRFDDDTTDARNDLSLHTDQPTRGRPTPFANVQSGPVSLPAMRSTPVFTSCVGRKKAEDTLCCPKCGQGFSEEEQDKLLEHMEICCE